MQPSDPVGPAGVTEALARLARLSLVDQSMESVSRTVVDLAKQVLPGRPEVSITMVVNGRPRTPSSTAALASELDERQYASGDGPCLEAAASGEVIEIADTADDPRWPDYCRIAAAAGNGSSLSVPLPIRAGFSGALNVYAREPHAFDGAAREAVGGFAPYAGAALSNMYAYQLARDMTGNLRVALESRAVIDQAKGILMERHRITADAAFQALAAVSMHSNTKVRAVAEQLVRTGSLDLDPR